MSEKKDDMKRCQHCRFWEGTLEDEEGDCRKYAPRPYQPSPSEEVGARSFEWPTTYFEDWCGDFETRWS